MLKRQDLKVGIEPFFPLVFSTSFRFSHDGVMFQIKNRARKHRERKMAPVAPRIPRMRASRSRCDQIRKRSRMVEFLSGQFFFITPTLGLLDRAGAAFGAEAGVYHRLGFVERTMLYLRLVGALR